MSSQPQKNRMIFEFNLVPIPKPRMTQRDRWAKRPCVLRYRAFADEMRLLARLQNFTLENGLAYEFHLPMPTSWTQKKRLEKLGQLHDQKPDLDNLIKALWDSLAKEDKTIASIGQVKKVWATTAKIIITKQI